MELVIAFVVMGIMMLAGTSRSGTATRRLALKAEANRLMSCLRWLREAARCKEKYYRTGYGLYFWFNEKSGSCMEYSPYTALHELCPDDPFNALSTNVLLGLPNRPVTLGFRTGSELKNATGYQLSGDMDIIFQTDDVEQDASLPDLVPNAVRQYPTNPKGSTATLNVPDFQPPYGVDANDTPSFAVVFWPPGQLPKSCFPQEFGVTLPTYTISGADYIFNRICIRSTRLPDTGTPTDRWPDRERIRIDPGTGVTRIMNRSEP